MRMMRIKMLQTKPGSPNGLRTEIYEKDRIYDVSCSLGKVFIDLGFAEEASITAEPAEEKSISAAPENKAMEGADDNKKKDEEDKVEQKTKSGRGRR